MARSGWAALAVTVLLVAGLGSEAAFDAALDANTKTAPLLDALTRFPTWSPSAQGFDSDMYGPVALKVLVLLAIVFLLARGAGRGGRSIAGFVAGWGALMLAAAASGVAYVVSADMLVLDGQLADSGGGAAAVVVDGLNSGVVFGLYTGWLVGLAVVVTAGKAAVQYEAEWDEVADERSVRMPSLAPAAPVPAVGAGAGMAAGPVRQPAGASASAAAARGDSLGGMTLVPGMPSVSPTAAPTPWAANPQQPPTRQSEPTTSGAWAAPPAPAAQTTGAGTGTGEPFVPAGTWPAEAAQSDTNGGSFITPGAWPPTPRPETPATGNPGTLDEWSNGSAPSPGYAQPEYSGLAPSTPPPEAPAARQTRLPARGPSQAVTSQMPAATPPRAAGGVQPPGAGAGGFQAPTANRVPPSSRQRPGAGSAAAGQGQPQPPPQQPQPGPMLQASGPPTGDPVTPTGALWPSKWPASAGGAYTDDPDAHTSAEVHRPGATSGNVGNVSDLGADLPDEGRADPETRFW